MKQDKELRALWVLLQRRRKFRGDAAYICSNIGLAPLTQSAYDALDRRVATIDGRNNRMTYAYNAKNNLVSTTDAVGAVTDYGYDVIGQTVAVTNALGNVTSYEYDLRGNKIYEGGATYPVRYTYDVFGNKTSMTTYRNEASGIGDTTTWTYDEASGVLLAKTYADGQGLTYSYTNDGRLATRTNARNIVTTYAYDGWGQLLSVDYADTTPDIAYVYDAMGRQTSATDAVGTTTFTYDTLGQLTSEQVSGLYSKTLTRHYDTFGRNVGYSVDGDRKQSITYDSVSGRIAESDGFSWEYLAGTNLKSQLTYPNEAVVTWTYEPHRDLLAAVTNATYSTYIYTNDLLGRRTSKNDEQYGYNIRGELISADEVSYAYDDIGNRTTAEGKSYTANNLNQYTAIDDFVPQYDADGNQTLIKTETGIWSVIYNAEKRPIRWESGDTIITMSFDRMGRRVEMRTVKDDEETLQRFVYDNYLCIQQLRTPSNTLYQSYVWDPTEPIATRPLFFLSASGETAYYFHDGNKNVVDCMRSSGDIIHYNYASFGKVTVSSSCANPFQFSSEVYDSQLAQQYYNFRHYSSSEGRWCTRDFMEGINLYRFTNNNSITLLDLLGLDIVDEISTNLEQNRDTLQELPCTFVFAVDRPGGERFSTDRVRDRLIDTIRRLFPKAEIVILENEEFNAPEVINALNESKCVCGFYYIGHALNDESRPRIVFDPNGTSLGSHIPPGREKPYRRHLNEVNGGNFSPCAVSGIIGCNTANPSSAGFGCSSSKIPSFAEAFSKHTKSSTWGTTDSINLNIDGGVTRGALFLYTEENGRKF